MRNRCTIANTFRSMPALRIGGYRSMLSMCLCLVGLVVIPARAQNVDDGFHPNADAPVRVVAAQADGKILIGGLFTNISGQSRSHLARLLPDDTLDPAFVATVVSGTISAIAVQNDGKILIGGTFTQLDAAMRNNLARSDKDGSADGFFNPNINASVLTLALQNNGKLLLGGAFTQVGASLRNHLARLNTDGSIDTGYNPILLV
jgi:uncharacterized delta-60 repeat protein